MRLRGRLTYHLSLHTRATVLRLWARAIENMPYIRLADLTQAGDLFSRIAAYLREFFDEATATDLLHHKTVGKDLADTPVATEALARHATRQATAERVTSFSELVARSLTRPCSDSAATGDSLTRAWGYGRNFSEGDLYAEPGYFADDYVAKDLEPVDTAYRGTSKPQADSTTASDSVSRVHSGLRSFTETVPATEWRTRTSGKPLVETLALTEALALSLFKPLSEDPRYAEDGYFADTYVTAGLVPADALSVTLNP